MLSRGRLAFVALSLVTILAVASGRMLAESHRQNDDGSDSLYKYLTLFTEVWNLVDRAYVEELEEDELMVGAVEGTLDALDPFSLYVPANEVERYLEHREIGIRRSGLRVLKERGVAYAAAVEEGSPAAEAGLERGHVIAEIEGRRTRTMPLWEIQALLAGPAGTEIELERIHQGQKETVRFELGEYPPPAVELRAVDGAAVLRLPAFHAATPEDVEASLRALASGAPELAGLAGADDELLIDLRGVAGGEEAVAYRVAGLFAAGELGALSGRDGEIEVFTGREDPLFKGRIVVLLDRGTQGAAEILASVLKQSAGASLVGEKSFGHSGRQRLVELSNGDRLQITHAFYTGPDREPIRRGLDPDVWVRPAFSTSEPESDEVLERGIELLRSDEETEERQAA